MKNLYSEIQATLKTTALATVATAMLATAAYAGPKIWNREYWKDPAGNIRDTFSKKKTEETSIPGKPAEKQTSQRKRGDCTDNSPGTIDYVVFEAENCELKPESERMFAAHCSGDIGDMIGYENHPLVFDVHAFLKSTGRDIKDITITIGTQNYTAGNTGVVYVPGLSEGKYQITINADGKAQVWGDLRVLSCPKALEEIAPESKPCSPCEKDHGYRQRDRDHGRGRGHQREHKPKAHAPGSDGEDLWLDAMVTAFYDAHGSLTVNDHRVLVADKSGDGLGGFLGLTSRTEVARASVGLMYTSASGHDNTPTAITEAKVEGWCFQANYLRFGRYFSHPERGQGKRFIHDSPVRLVGGLDIAYGQRTTEQPSAITQTIETSTLSGNGFIGAGVGMPDRSYGFLGAGWMGERTSNRNNEQQSSQGGPLAILGAGYEGHRLTVEGSARVSWPSQGDGEFDAREVQAALEATGRYRLGKHVGLVARGGYLTIDNQTDGRTLGVMESNTAIKRAQVGVAVEL